MADTNNENCDTCNSIRRKGDKIVHKTTKRILIVDDSRFVREAASASLMPQYEVTTAPDGESALNYMAEHPVDLVLMDLEMPGLNGIETMTKMKKDKSLKKLPVIFLTGTHNPETEAGCLALGANDFITKPFSTPVLLCRVSRVLELEGLRRNLEIEVEEKTREVEKLTLQTITTFANSIDSRINKGGRHSFHVAKYSEQLGRLLGFSNLELRDLYYAALLHDIGKIGIPDFILSKPEPLTEDEYNIIKRHPEIGGRILGDITVVPFLSIAAATHHEWYNGKGYPAGLKGEEIPLVGRIVGIADAVDAMCSERVYRTRISRSEVVDELNRCAGTQFDPFLAKMMAAVLMWGVDLSEETGTDTAHADLLTTVMNEYMKVSQRDTLTGLWNRAYVENMVEKNCATPGMQGAFVLLDIDNFKYVNDMQGHQQGDACLRVLGECICLEIDDGDFAGRLGGDEFVIYYAGTLTRDDVSAKVTRLLGKIEKNSRFHGTPPITVSVGVAMMPLDGADFPTLYQNADNSLYCVKRNGKNDIVFFSMIEPNQAIDVVEM